MDFEITSEQQELQDELALNQRRLAELDDERHAVEAELQSLAGQREKFELVENICSSLDKLEALDAADLFWGDKLPSADWQTHLAAVREQSASFGASLGTIEARHIELQRAIVEQDDLCDLLHDRLLELEEEEEQRQNDWVVEREESEELKRWLIMPWARGTEEDRRFQKSLLGSVAASLLLALLLSMVDLPIPDKAELMRVPERIAKVIELPPAPPPVEPVVEREPEPEPEEPVLADEQPVEVQPVEEVPEVVQPAQVAEQQATPKPQVRSKGILAFRESFSDRARSGPAAKLGAQASIGNSGEAAVGRPTRAMVTTDAPGSSGGINLAAISRDVGGGAGGGQLGGVTVTQVASSIGGGGGGGADRPRAGGGRSAGRTDEEIQIVFDRYKASLYRLYNRELRRDPTLRGQLVLKLTIEPDGSVSMCMLERTDLRAPQLTDQIVARVQGFDFGAKEDISAMTIIYPIDFLPATT